jgi:hypothetical protein
MRKDLSEFKSLVKQYMLEGHPILGASQSNQAALLQLAKKDPVKNAQVIEYWENIMKARELLEKGDVTNALKILSEERKERAKVS